MSRAAFLLLAALATLSLGPATPPAWWGGISIGMTRAAALREAGSGALVGPLCGDAEGVTFDRIDPALSLEPQRPVTVMAMFDADSVSELDVLAAAADGGLSHGQCTGAAADRMARLARSHGVPPPAFAARDDTVLHHAEAGFAVAAGRLSVIVRHMPRSGACFINLRWIEAGRQSAIR